MSTPRNPDERMLGDLLGDAEYMAGRAAELTSASRFAPATSGDSVGMLRGIATITGEPFDGLKADFDKGGPLARVLSALLSIQKRGPGNPRPNRSTEHWWVVGILKAGGFKGDKLREAIVQTVECHDNQVDTWIKGYREARKSRGETNLLSAIITAPQTDLVQKALRIALEG